jgi:hypothetical protein
MIPEDDVTHFKILNISQLSSGDAAEAKFNQQAQALAAMIKASEADPTRKAHYERQLRELSDSWDVVKRNARNPDSGDYKQLAAMKFYGMDNGIEYGKAFIYKEKNFKTGQEYGYERKNYINLGLLKIYRDNDITSYYDQKKAAKVGFSIGLPFLGLDKLLDLRINKKKAARTSQNRAGVAFILGAGLISLQPDKINIGLGGVKNPFGQNKLGDLTAFIANALTLYKKEKTLGKDAHGQEYADNTHKALFNLFAHSKRELMDKDGDITTGHSTAIFRTKDTNWIRWGENTDGESFAGGFKKDMFPITEPPTPPRI